MLIIAVISCKTKTDAGAGKSSNANAPEKDILQDKIPSENTSENTDLTDRLVGFLQDRFKEDMEFLKPEDRKFQFDQLDLNGDGNKEIFIRFLTSYFCGTGGCDLLLLKSDLSEITHFTVMNVPLWIEQTQKNGWRIILTRDRDGLKELSYENGTYPNNSSMVEKAPYDAASGNAYIMFDENFNPAITHDF
ncbi:hypothetical protein DMZ48_11915 [Robertkochia solimangrovi]|nr:hypothetical protein DMZ48_11915 [Robertkochia solimangrovi]